MNTFIAFVLAGSIASVNPYENIDVSKMNSVEKEFVVDQEAKIKNSVPKIHDEIQQVIVVDISQGWSEDDQTFP